MRRILCVDDERNVLLGLQRQLRKQFELEISSAPEDALKVLREGGPFAVVVSDMRMPRMDGVEFLGRVREIAPDTVRIMLTGNADQQTAIDAVNKGHIFRFLNKPCSPDLLAMTLEAALEQHRVIRAERELLASTLNACVRLLTEVLSLVNPAAFGRTEGLRRLVKQLCQTLKTPNAWEIEIAAMLAHVGCIAVPQDVLRKLAAGERLTPSESEAYRRHPTVGADLIEKIPRLGGVARIVRCQLATAGDDAGLAGETPYAAKMLQTALEYETAVAGGYAPEEIIARLRSDAARAPKEIVDALAGLAGLAEYIGFVTIDELQDGMVLDAHVQTNSGELLLARGHEVVPWIRQRLSEFAASPKGVRQPIQVRCPVPPANAESATKSTVCAGSS
jgi:response regulator RpfG family c-di-GMP phosphodiesterase